MMKPNQTTYPPRLHQRGMLLLLLLVCLLPSRLFAQSYALRVTLHDVGGVAIAGVTVSVRDEDGRELGRGLTGSDGATHFTDLPAVVRVAVVGQPRGGPSLYQIGDDAQGIRIMLDAGAEPTVLNLRAEPDGLVLPDPATMITREEGGPVVSEAPALPTAAIATPAPLPTAQASVPPAAPSDEQTAAAPAQAGWVPLATTLIIALAAGVLLLIRRRRSAL